MDLSPKPKEYGMTAMFQIGDIVFAQEALYNDGHIPDIPAEASLAAPGDRGVVVQIGRVAAGTGSGEQFIYLVRFEQADQRLGPPVGCLPEELTQDEAAARALAAAD